MRLVLELVASLGNTFDDINLTDMHTEMTKCFVEVKIKEDIE
jgi:hypothetical protein